jgi:hypothetical protein
LLAWHEYHRFIDGAKASVVHHFGRGVYLDIHGLAASLQIDRDLRDDSWHHYALSVKDGQAQVFFDGKLHLSAALGVGGVSPQRNDGPARLLVHRLGSLASGAMSVDPRACSFEAAANVDAKRLGLTCERAESHSRALHRRERFASSCANPNRATLGLLAGRVLRGRIGRRLICVSLYFASSVFGARLGGRARGRGRVRTTRHGCRPSGGREQAPSG